MSAFSDVPQHTVQCFLEDFVNLWKVDLCRVLPGHAPPQVNVVHFEVKCINLVHIENKIKRLEIYEELCALVNNFVLI